MTKKTTTTTTNKTDTTILSKKSKIAKKHNAIALLLVVIIIAGYFFFNQTSNNTKISTPIIARTELDKKPAIDIQMFDETQQPENKEITVEEDDTPKTQTQPGNSKIIEQLTNIEIEQTKLKEQVEQLINSNKLADNQEIITRLEKLESLNGNIGNLSKIFLLQQLVLLDNAFKVGGNQNLAIENIYNFAKNVAKQEKVSLKLQELLNLTQQQAIITPQALMFYAQKLESIPLHTLEKAEEPSKDLSLLEKIRELLKSFISIKKTNEITQEQLYWNNSIKKLQEAIIFADYITVKNILAEEKMLNLGKDDFANFNQLFTTYLKQQQALQATLGAFIEGYNYAN